MKFSNDGKGDWQIFFDVADDLRDYDESGGPIRIVPMKRCPWSLASQLPTLMLSDDNLWQEIRSFYYDHIDLIDPLQYDVLVAWTKAMWLLEKWQSVPYLMFLGPVGSGKTRALDALAALCYRSLRSSSISSAAIFRGVEKFKPAMLLDETEIYTKDSYADVIGLLNSGYRRGQFAIRVTKVEDANPELGLYDVFGFKALAGIDGHKQTIMSKKTREQAREGEVEN